MIGRIQARVIAPNCSLLAAMKQMDAGGFKTLFVFWDNKFVGLLTIGDIQRAIIRGISLSAPVSAILDKNKVYGFVSEPQEDIRNKMRRLRAEVMPILDDEHELVDVWFWGDQFKSSEASIREAIDLPVVIMAGGKGTRLKPLTNVIPKPLVPIGDKTILEEIMDRFESIGCHNFYMSVNYKAEMMHFYLNQLEHKYNIEFFEEDKPLGTIGSVSLLKGKLKSPFFVSNCDIIIDQDYRDVYDYHIENRNDLTLVTAVKSFRIPYGVIETGEDGLMEGLQEKPELTYMINTGLYLLNPDCIDEIPEGDIFHITQLIERIKAKKGRVGCFPVSERSWRDMGEWPEYLKMIDVL
jgi:dTDP-glucose pyrophosphorylase